MKKTSPPEIVKTASNKIDKNKLWRADLITRMKPQKSPARASTLFRIESEPNNSHKSILKINSLNEIWSQEADTVLTDSRARKTSLNR